MLKIMFKEITEEHAKLVSLRMGANKLLPDKVLIALGKEWYKTTHTNSNTYLDCTPRQAIDAYKILVSLGYRYILLIRDWILTLIIGIKLTNVISISYG